MATEIIVFRWCDVHLAESEGVEKVPGEAYVVTIGGADIDGKPREIDLCEQHRLDLMKPLLDVLVTHGGKPEALPHATGPKRPKPEQTHACTLCASRSATAGTLRNHYITEHGQTMADALGTATRWCGVKGCGQGYEGIQGIGVHLARSHGIADKDERDALMLAKKPRSRAR